ncbi:hypothetical protein [Methylomonas methanica]|uniref:Nitroreductase n=1 Tax=Methylomonas methanica (strain DSM 25384 / MC09) TaxID=857087 RepID=F9ZY08_METMM|nr:hypothetical protein [Methylomonas methanica]AEF99738.1 hypothetical protein Metme_1312 [Methylomonas methanica MC09]
MNTISEKNIMKLIEVGIRAPSADNGQPWKFKLLDDGFELWLDQDNMGLFFDVNQVATQMSCGALIENVTLLADAMGFATSISYFNEASGKFAQLAFASVGDRGDVESVTRTIFNRYTDRNLFQFHKKISNSQMAELVSLVQSDRNYRLHTYQTPQDRKAIIRTITATDTIRFIHKRIHNDFYHVLRFGDTAQKNRDGLAAATLGIESFMIPVLRMLKPWWLTKLLNYIGLHHVMALRGTWLPMRSAPVIVSITHKGGADYVEFGRIMQRFWLQANEAGLSVQPLGALPLFLARCHLLQGEGFTSDQLKMLKAVTDDFARITPLFNKEADQIVMLFRLGYAKKNKPRAFRRDVESFLRD